MYFLPKFVPRNDEDRLNRLKLKFLRREAKIGGQLFGPIPKGHQREFFCLDKHTWIWHEAWTDQSGEFHTVTTTYNVRQNAVIKSQNGSGYQSISDNEARNLYTASELYLQKVTDDYHLTAQTA
jgi:hypothetical protein